MASQSGNDHAMANTSARGSRVTAKPVLNVVASPPSRSATACGSTRVRGEHEPADSLGMRGEHPHQGHQHGAPPPAIAADTSMPRSRPGDMDDRVGHAPDVQRQEGHHGDEIQHALHDDGRERGRDHQPFLPGQQIRPQHVTSARRQHPESGEPDDGRPECRSKPRRSDRLEQVLPAPCADDIRGYHGEETGAPADRCARAAPATRRQPMFAWLRNQANKAIANSDTKTVRVRI